MLGLYLYTLIIGHKSCNMLSILNKLTLQKKLQKKLTNNVVLDKKSKNTTTTKQKYQTLKPLPEQGIEPRDLSRPKRMRYFCTTESTESNDCSQAIYLFRGNGSKRK